MGFLTGFTIKSKLLIMLLAVSICSLLLVAYLGYSNGKATLTERVFNQLTSVRAAKVDQIESYFQNIRNQIQVLSDDRMFISAMQEFKAAYQKLETAKLPKSADAAISTYYQQEFLPRLAATMMGKPVLDAYLPEVGAARYLQYHYIAANANPVGKKHLLEDAGDGSEYSRLHAQYHPIFREFIDKFGYYDIFLIDPDTGAIVYSVFKETDYATRLNTGAYSETNLAESVTRARKSKVLDYVDIVDFQPYAPSYGAPAAFISSPIYDGSELIGILAFQLPVNQINAVMTGHNGWKQNGLGKSGEVYLVGQDYRMRSVSRFLVEDPEGYIQSLRSLNVSDRTIQQIQQYKTSILQQEVRTDAAKQALAGKTGTQVVKDYRDISVLSASAPIHIEGLNWAIISEMDLSEAYAPIYALAKSIFVSVAFIVVLITFIAMALTGLFVKPINLLIESARKVEAGEADVLALTNSQDEFDQLAQSFNSMVSSLRQEAATLERKNQESEALLANLFPAVIVQRLKSGEKDISDEVSNVTVLMTDLVGFTALAASLHADQALFLLNALVTSFDETAERIGVEKIKTIGDGYMAACGLLNPCLEHDKRIVDFALEMQTIVQQFNRDRSLQLSLRMGVHSGKVTAGIIGTNRFIYDLWGEPVNLADTLKDACQNEMILVSQTVYKQLQGLYSFQEAKPITRGRTQISTWSLSKTLPESLVEESANIGGAE